jgi:hypothetical protein
MVMSHPQSGATQKYRTRLKIVIGERRTSLLSGLLIGKKKEVFQIKYYVSVHSTLPQLVT